MENQRITAYALEQTEGGRSDVSVQEIGILTPKLARTKSLRAGQVGYVISGMKSTKEARVGDTLVSTVKCAVSLISSLCTQFFAYCSTFLASGKITIKEISNRLLDLRMPSKCSLLPYFPAMRMIWTDCTPLWTSSVCKTAASPH